MVNWITLLVWLSSIGRSEVGTSYSNHYLKEVLGGKYWVEPVQVFREKDFT